MPDSKKRPLPAVSKADLDRIRKRKLVIKKATRSDGRLTGRNIFIGEHRTSVRLEPQMWDALQEICLQKKCTLNKIFIELYSREDWKGSFTSALRVYIMMYFREASKRK